MSKKVTKEEPRPSKFVNDKAKKDKIKDDIKKDLPSDLKDGFEFNPEIVLLHAILRELQK